MNIFHEGWEPLENIEIPCNNTREELEQRSFFNSIDLVLGTLNERERLIIKERFWNDKTYKEIGQEYNVCGSRVSQIEAKALRKLRHPIRTSFLIHDNKDTIFNLKDFNQEFNTSNKRDSKVYNAHQALLHRIFEKIKKVQSKHIKKLLDKKKKLSLLEKEEKKD